MNGLGLRRLGKNVGAILGRQLGVGLLQLATLAIIARVYGPEGNGAYTVALLLPTTLATLLNLGIGPANVYYLGSSQVNLWSAWRATLKLFWFIAAVGLVLGSTTLWLYGEQWFPGVPMGLLWTALLVFPASLLLMLISSLFQGIQKFRQYNLVLLAQPVITLVLVALLAWLRPADVSALLIAYLAGSVVAVVFALSKLYTLVDTKVGATDRYEASLLTYGYKAHLSNILAFVNYKADIFLVNFFIGPAGAGIYVVAVQLSERLWLLSKAVSTALLPRLSELSHDEAKRIALTPLIARWVLVLTLIAAVLLAAIAYPVIVLIFGSEFAGAYAALVLLLPGIVLGAGSRILANDIAARGRPEINMYTSFIVVIVNIIGNVILIPAHGINGAAMATTIAYALNFLVRLFVHRHFTSVPILASILVERRDLALIKAAFTSKPKRRGSEAL